MPAKPSTCIWKACTSCTCPGRNRGTVWWYRCESAGQRREVILLSISIEEAQAKLPEIIGKLGPGEEVVITRNDQPVAKLVSQYKAARQPRQPGSAKGILVINIEDDEHLTDFAEYMP